MQLSVIYKDGIIEWIISRCIVYALLQTKMKLAQDIWPAAGQIFYRLHNRSNSVTGQTRPVITGQNLSHDIWSVVNDPPALWEPDIWPVTALNRLRQYVQAPNGAYRYRLKIVSLRQDEEHPSYCRRDEGSRATDDLNLGKYTRIRQSAN